MADFPISIVFVATLALSVASVEAGYRWARARQADRQQEAEAPIGAMVGATLGLLGFLLAFTFGLAADAFHGRKVALMEEANAIRMTYLLTDTIPDAHRAEIRGLIGRYVDERIRWGTGPLDPADGKAQDLLRPLWKAGGAVGAANPGSVDVFLTYLGRVVELQQERILVRERGRIPGAYWGVLVLVAALAMAGVGYHGGVAGTARSPAMVAVAIAFSAVIMVIADLDRPGHGFIRVSQEPMIELQRLIAETKP